eukprot:605907-Rhodomonas_salina.1
MPRICRAAAGPGCAARCRKELFPAETLPGSLCAVLSEPAQYRGRGETALNRRCGCSYWREALRLQSEPNTQSWSHTPRSVPDFA